MIAGVPARKKGVSFISFFVVRIFFSEFVVPGFCFSVSLHRCFFCLSVLFFSRFTGTLLHTDSVTRRSWYKQTLLHTNAFTHRPLYTKTPLHTNTLTHKCFYTQTLLYTDPVTHRLLYTHRRFYTQTLSLSDPFTHRLLCAQEGLHTNTFTHIQFHTPTLSHTISHFFVVFPMIFTKTARYHDATNNTRYLIFSWHFP